MQDDRYLPIITPHQGSLGPRLGYRTLVAGPVRPAAVGFKGRGSMGISQDDEATGRDAQAQEHRLPSHQLLGRPCWTVAEWMWIIMVFSYSIIFSRYAHNMRISNRIDLRQVHRTVAAPGVESSVKLPMPVEP